MQGALAANLAVGAAILLAGVALLLAVVGIVAWRRLGNARLLWVTLAFLGFVAEGVALAWRAYDKRADIAAGGSPELLLLAVGNLAIVACLYLAVLKR
jgi:hypothetical protein